MSVRTELLAKLEMNGLTVDDATAIYVSLARSKAFPDATIWERDIKAITEQAFHLIWQAACREAVALIDFKYIQHWSRSTFEAQSR